MTERHRATRPMDSSSGNGRRSGLLLAFPSSNQNVRADLHALQGAGMLTLFCTTIAWRHGRGLFGILPRPIRQELARRAFDGIDPARISTFPTREVIRLIASRLGISVLTRHETGWASVDRVSKQFDHHVAHLIRRRSLDAAAVYAYEYAALRSFEAAAERGMRRFYELPTGYWRVGLKILTEERERNPEWAQTLDLLQDSAQKREHKDAEIRAADHIIVPSAFVRETLREHPDINATIDVIPYGAPDPKSVPRAPRARSRADKLRLLYVGNLTQLKGISYLFSAMLSLRGAATLTLAGAKPSADCPKLTAALKEHTWLGAVPHQRVLEIMAQHDVLVFPTLFDGFGLVILEAMSQGLTVITTPNAGGSSVIDDGKDGFVVPIQDAEAIAKRVMELADDRERLFAMGAAAVKKAELLSWAARAGTFLEILGKRLSISIPETRVLRRGSPALNAW
jgi:glycosyltransferase involved in cell wall biosynthesis